MDHSPRNKINNGQSPVIDMTYNVLPNENDENKFTEPCAPARKRLRSKEPDDISSPGEYFSTIF